MTTDRNYGKLTAVIFVLSVVLAAGYVQYGRSMKGTAKSRETSISLSQEKLFQGQTSESPAFQDQASESWTSQGQASESRTPQGHSGADNQ